MTRVTYEIKGTGQKVSSWAEAKATGRPFVVHYEPIVEPCKVSASRYAKIKEVFKFK